MLRRVPISNGKEATANGHPSWADIDGEEDISSAAVPHEYVSVVQSSRPDEEVSGPTIKRGITIDRIERLGTRRKTRMIYYIKTEECHL